MKLNRILFEHFAPQARETTVRRICLGLGYTAVSTAEGNLGLSYTYIDRAADCRIVKAYRDFEGACALDLLERIRGSDPLERSMALALVNALNEPFAQTLPEDPGNRVLLERLGISPGKRIAMVGHFQPLVRKLSHLGAELDVLDEFQGLGRQDRFYERLATWADALILTATALLNNTAEAILNAAGPRVQTLLLGPSTPMVPDAFAGMPVHLLAGAVPVDADGVWRSVRHGTGTPVISRYTKKVCCPVVRTAGSG